jgi:predicted aminopeptidase
MIFRPPALLLLITLLTACSGPAYYLQAASGQWKLMYSRQDLQSLLNDPATSPELVAQLNTAGQIRLFAEQDLGLPANESYLSYVEVDGDAVVWNVVATEEFSLEAKEWCFPVAGCVPYRGFFKQQKAKDSAARLSRKGMDVIVSPASAYSTLGWFADPLLSTMLSGSDVRLAAYLFHELAHQRLYVKGDGVFNEAYASFVEKEGVDAWLESQQRREDLLNWHQTQSASKDFTTLIINTRTALSLVYISDQPDAVKRDQKAGIFDSLVLSYEQASAEKWSGKRYYDRWFEAPLNNAKLALYSTYESGLCAFQELLDKAENNLHAFHQLAERKSRLQKAERDEWLQQECPSIAPQDNL